MAYRASEVKGVVELLLAEHDSPEDAAKAVITWLDNDRAKRTGYIAVMQFGGEFSGKAVFYLGLGPYPGKRSAEKAVRSHPAAGDATKIVVLPVVPPEGVTEMLRTIDTYQRPA